VQKTPSFAAPTVNSPLGCENKITRQISVVSDTHTREFVINTEIIRAFSKLAIELKTASVVFRQYETVGNGCDNDTAMFPNFFILSNRECNTHYSPYSCNYFYVINLLQVYFVWWFIDTFF